MILYASRYSVKCLDKLMFGCFENCVETLPKKALCSFGLFLLCLGEIDRTEKKNGWFPSDKL
jgi:hypothetical protein